MTTVVESLSRGGAVPCAGGAGRCSREALSDMVQDTGVRSRGSTISASAQQAFGELRGDDSAQPLQHAFGVAFGITCQLGFQTLEPAVDCRVRDARGA